MFTQIFYNKLPLKNKLPYLIDGTAAVSGNSNIYGGDPGFMLVNPIGGAYFLSPNSLCRDRGCPVTQYNDPDGSRNDMGAYGGPDALDFK